MSQQPVQNQTFRTIEEAKALQLPKTPPETVKLIEADFTFASRGNAGRLSRLKRLYHAVDLLMSEVSPYAVCRKGCAHCCYIDVVMTDIEADYIVKNTNLKKNSGNNRTSGYSQTKTPCPHLTSDQTCSIYEFRPYHCRAFLTLDDPHFCKEPSTSHVTYDGRGHKMLSDLAALLVELNGRGNVRDIRDFFGE